MVSVKSLETIKKNFEAGATVAPSRYVDGVKAASWKDAASSPEAEALYAAKVSEAVATGRRAAAIEKVSDSTWRDSAVKKGGARIGEGMRAAVDKQASNFAPFRSALEAVSLPARSADAMSNVDNRVKPIVAALVAKKKEILA
jgi:hypothetical protein